MVLTLRVSYIFHHFPTPHGFQTSTTSTPFLHICGMWTPTVGTSELWYDETRGALPWSGLDAKTQEEKYRPLPTSIFRLHSRIRDLKHCNTHQYAMNCHELLDFELFLKLIGLSFGMLLDVSLPKRSLKEHASRALSFLCRKIREKKESTPLDELCAGDSYCWRCTFVKF